MPFSDEMKWELTGAEAAKMIRNAPAGSRFRVSVRIELPIVDKPDRIFPGMASVSVSRKEMARIAQSMVKNFEDRGGRVPLRMTVYTVGNSSRNNYYI